MRILFLSYICSAVALTIVYTNHRVISGRDIKPVVGIDSLHSNHLRRRGHPDRSLAATSKSIRIPHSNAAAKSSSSSPPVGSLLKSTSDVSSLAGPRIPSEHKLKRKSASSLREDRPNKSTSPGGRSSLSLSAGSAQYLRDVFRIDKSPSPPRSPSPPIKYSAGGTAIPRTSSNMKMYQAWNTFRSSSPGGLGLNPPRISLDDFHRAGFHLIDDPNSPTSSREPSPDPIGLEMLKASANSPSSLSGKNINSILASPGSSSPPVKLDVQKISANNIRHAEMQSVDNCKSSSPSREMSPQSPSPQINTSSIQSAPQRSDRAVSLGIESSGYGSLTPFGRLSRELRSTRLRSSDRQQSLPF